MKRLSVVTVDLVESNMLDDIMSLLHHAISHTPEGVKQELQSRLNSISFADDSNEE